MSLIVKSLTWAVQFNIYDAFYDKFLFHVEISKKKLGLGPMLKSVKNTPIFTIFNFGVGLKKKWKFNKF